MHHQGFNYVDDFIGFGTPNVVQQSFLHLHDHLKHLGLQISTKKLVKPATEAAFIGVFINTIECTIAILQDKLEHICGMVEEWENKKYCSKLIIMYASVSNPLAYF